MVVINLFGGPGSGKSTTAALLFAMLKNEGVKAELVGEVAKSLIYEGRGVQLDRNQFLISAMQYGRLVDLEESGCDVAISDSPLRQGLIYAQHEIYEPELRELVSVVCAQFQNKDILIKRGKHYSRFGRTQEEDAALRLDNAISMIDPTMPEIPGTPNGADILCNLMVTWYKKGSRWEFK